MSCYNFMHLEMEGARMLKHSSIKNRNELREKMAEMLNDRIKALPVEMQYILLDDLVTAFENRLSMFSRLQSVC